MIEDFGINVIAPLLSTLTAGALLYTGKFFVKTSRILSGLDARVENNEEDIQNVRKQINQLYQKKA